MSTISSLIAPRTNSRCTLFANPSLIAALGVLGVVTAVAPAANAQTTVYNFQAGSTGSSTTYSGKAGLGSLLTYTGNTFNREVYVGGGSNQAGGLASTLLNSQGVAASGVIFTYFASTGPISGSDTTATDAATLLQEWGTTSTTADISLTGLPANASFTAVFYGENGTNADGRTTVYQLTNSSFTPFGSAKNTTANSGTSFTTNPGNYVFFTGTTSASGGIYATYSNFTGNNGAEGDFTAAQFAITTTSAPEPSAFLLFAPGAIGLIAARRRRTG